jgi:hypothetical protein
MWWERDKNKGQGSEQGSRCWPAQKKNAGVGFEAKMLGRGSKKNGGAGFGATMLGIVG